MASLATAWSPNSFQLRLALTRRSCPPAVYKRIRVRKLDRQVRLFSVAGGSVSNGSGTERRRIGDSWSESNSSVDVFSGWSGANGGGPLNESGWKQSFVGVVGAGVAGIILVTGVAFAALSISRKSTPRQSQQIETIEPQQHKELSSGDLFDQIEEEKYNGENEMQKISNQQSKTGTENDSLNKAKNESASDDTDVEYISNDGDITNITSLQQQDLENESTISKISLAPQAMQKVFEPNTSNGSLAVSSFKHSDGANVSADLEFTTEVKEKPSDAKPTNLDYETRQTSLADEFQDEVSVVVEKEISSFTQDLSSSHDTDLPLEHAFYTEADSQLHVSLNPVVVPVEFTETSDLQSTEEPKRKSPIEMREQNIDISPKITSPSAMAYQQTNLQGYESYNDIDGVQSIFGSPNTKHLSVSSGIPAPSEVSADTQALPGKVLVPAVVDQVQGQAFAALQVLKVIEADVQPGDLCTRREYARWLVSASSALSRNTISKVYPAMYIENITNLAFDDITPEDPDFTSIQGLAEAGLIYSKLSRGDMNLSDDDTSPLHFSPESPLSRQDLVSWKMALEKRQLPVADRKAMQQLSGFIDIDKINQDAWPAILGDLSGGEQGIISLAFGYTRLFQPHKPVTKAQAAIALATGEAYDIVSEELARIEAECMAEKAVAAHNALVAQVEKDLNAKFEKEFLLEREKINTVKKLAEDATRELERLRGEREEENIAIMKERAAVESEMEVLSKLRHEMEEQLQAVTSKQVEISYEKERVGKLQNDARIESQEISQLHYELEVERKALAMARTWAEDEAKRAREQAKALEEARDRWEKHGIKVIVDDDLREEANAGVTWLTAGQELSVEGSVSRAENLVDKLKTMAGNVEGRSRDIIHKVIQKILLFISQLKEWTLNIGKQAGELKDAAMLKVDGSLQELRQSSAKYAIAAKEAVKRVAVDCRGGVEKLSQKFKT